MIPSTVRDVSAMFVATMHFLTPSGAYHRIHKKINVVSFSVVLLDVICTGVCNVTGRYRYKPFERSWPEGQRAAVSRWAAQPEQEHSPSPPNAPLSDQTSPVRRRINFTPTGYTK